MACARIVSQRGSRYRIGTMHRSFLFLIAIVPAVGGCVSFEYEEEVFLNVDGSGRGDREAFLLNVDRHVGSRDGLVVLRAAREAPRGSSASTREARWRWASA